jgi:hypothetical protein
MVSGNERLRALCRHSRKEDIMFAGTAGAPFSTLSVASSDTELERRLANFLFQRQVPDGNCVRLIARGGVVIVRGELPSRHAKWLCIECCRRVAGVLKVVDKLTVAPATVQFPDSLEIATKLEQYASGSHHKSNRSRPFYRVAASRSVAHGGVAASQRANLPSAA